MSPGKPDSREMLADALVDLGKSVPFNKITIKQICEAAGVSQRTFYNHFVDKFDLMAWVYRKGLSSAFEQAQRSNGTYYDLQLACIRNMVAGQRYTDNTLHNTHGRDSLRLAIRRCNMEVFRERLQKLLGEHPDQQLLFTLDLFLMGAVDSMIVWYDDGMLYPAETLARWITESMSEALRHYLDHVA